MNEIELLLLRLKTPENVGSAYRLAMQYGIKKIYNYKSLDRKPGKHGKFAEVGSTDTGKAHRLIPTEYVDSLEFLKDYPYPKYILETGGQDINEAKTTGKFLLAICHEGHGASQDELKYFDQILTLPAPNTVWHERMISYNVTHALAIGLYVLEYYRMEL